MSQVQPLPSGSAISGRSSVEKLGRLSPDARRNFQELMKNGDEDALAALVLEVLRYHLPKGTDGTTGAWSDDSRLGEELGFDSLATVETVFFFEDLFQISILNTEIANLRTVGDLRRFLRGKLEAGKA
jgi:acyl carrier protein